MKCIICSSKNLKIIWYDYLRETAKKFTTKKHKIIRCENCDLVFLKNRFKYLENSAISRSLYNKSNSYKDFVKFHKPREEKKLNSIKNKINFKGKRILESNCGTGILLEKLKNKAKLTAGLDNKFYKKFFLGTKHIFYTNLPEIIRSNKKFDIILSLSEIEHKYNPIKFLKDLKKILEKKGKIVIRVPNYDNIYANMLGKYFFKYDYRKSHNFYFSKNNFSMMLKKLEFKIEKVYGFNEYSPNHLMEYLKTKKRVYKKKFPKVLSAYNEKIINKNIEESFKSTSLIFIIKNYD